MDHAWWIDPKQLVHVLHKEYFAETRIYARKLDREWEYAVVEFRHGTAYLFGLYRNGSNCTPVDPTFIENADVPRYARRALR